jgi:WhiB family transcriptional regulator, redox-sensing transcriptional regulator
VTHPMPHPPGKDPADARSTQMHWAADAACRGQTHLYFAPPGERPEAREAREALAWAVCDTCRAVDDCRSWARRHREYGFWGGESEEDRAAAGFRVEMPVGRIARYPRGEGMPVQPRPERRTGATAGRVLAG